MKKLLCIVCLLAAVLFVDTASACSTGRCGGKYYGHSSYTRTFRSGRNYGFRGHHGYTFHGHRGYGRSFSGRRFGRHGYGFRTGRSYSCTRCGGFRRW